METSFALLVICAGNSLVTVNSPHKGQWRGDLMFSFICAWINGWVNNHQAGDLRRHRAHYDDIVMGIIKVALLTGYTVFLTLKMLNCFNCLKDHQRCIHISYDISYFVSRRLNSHLSNTTCCLPFAVNTMPADALFIKIARTQIGIVLTKYRGIFRLWHQ